LPATGLRCVTQPDPAQAALLDRLGIVLPKRMRLAEREPALAHIERGLPHQKCSADFSANLLICLKRMADSAQVGLAYRITMASKKAPVCVFFFATESPPSDSAAAL
jgi:hypothetical protein